MSQDINCTRRNNRITAFLNGVLRIRHGKLSMLSVFLLFLVVRWFIPGAISTKKYSLRRSISKTKGLDTMNYNWAHAVNSKKLLNTALSNPTFNAIEADVIFSSNQASPVMGHPPQVDGDLSLNDFLNKIYDSKFSPPKSFETLTARNNIVKLDFKSAQAFDSSMDLIRNFVSNTQNPRKLFLNADILQGPCSETENCAPKFDAKEFLRLAESISGAVLSIGWTTGSNPLGKYTDSMVNEMIELLEQFPDVIVTFPIRATSFRSSWSALRKLYDKSLNYGVTLWWSKSEMETEELAWIYNTLENNPNFKGRTFYDILGFDKFKKHNLGI